MPPPPLPSTSSDLAHLASFDGTSPSADFAQLSLVSPRTDLTPSPFQPWAPFERKEHPTKVGHEDKMEVDISSTSANSPPASVSPRSRSRSPHSPRRHSSPTSTAVTTPPSPREPKLPDVPSSQPPIADSPESPPHIQVDTPSPLIPIPQDDDEMTVDDERPVTPPPRPSHPALTPPPETPQSPPQRSLSPAYAPLSPKPVPPQPESHPLPPSPNSEPAPARNHTPPPHESIPHHEREPSPAPVSIPTPVPAPAPEAVPPPAPAPVPETSPAPPAPPKVKLSLKDFAARKKRQREEGGTLSAQSADASPMVPAKSLQGSPKIGPSGVGAAIQGLASSSSSLLGPVGNSDFGSGSGSGSGSSLGVGVPGLSGSVNVSPLVGGSVKVSQWFGTF